MQLYQISDTYRSLVAMSYEAETQEEYDAVLHQIDQLEAQLEDRAEILVRMYKNEEADIPGLDAEIARLREMKAAREARIASVKSLLVNMIESATEPGEKSIRIKTMLGELRTQSNSVAKVIYEGDPKALPEAFRLVVPIKYEVDTKAVQTAYKGFEQVWAETLKQNSNAVRHDVWLKWCAENDFPTTIEVERGKHLRLA